MRVSLAQYATRRASGVSLASVSLNGVTNRVTVPNSMLPGKGIASREKGCWFALAFQPIWR